MIEFSVKASIMIVAAVMVVAIWQSRTDKLMRIRKAKTYALIGLCFVSIAEGVKSAAILGEINELITPATRQVADLSASAVVSLGMVICMLAVWRWLDAGKKLSWIADYQVERSGELHARLVESGLALSTVPAVLYRASNISCNPASARFEFLNDKVEEILGYSRHELESNPRGLTRLMHPEDRRQFFYSDLPAAMRRERSVLEHRFRHRDGSYRWIRRHVRQVGGTDGRGVELIGCAFDVTDLKGAEARLQNFMEFAPDAVLMVDRGRKIIMANTLAIDTFANSGEDLVGQKIDTLFADDSRRLGLQLIGAEFATESVRREVSENEIVCRRNDGSELPAEIVPRAIDVGERCFVAISIRDVSARKETEAKLHQAQKMEAVGQLTGGLAHDFNNMLTVITGNLQMIDLENLSESDRDYADEAMRAVDLAADLTSRLLTFSRQQVLRPEDVLVNDLVNNIQGLLCRTIGEEITFQTNLSDEVWPVRADPSQLENALVNLTINARDALESGGHLEITTANIVIGDGNDSSVPDLPPGEYVLLAVGDNGSGISEGRLQRIFEPFYTTKEPGKGSGLGLSMVYGFVKQSGGNVLISSKDGVGTTVKLYLPRSSNEGQGAIEQVSTVDDSPTGTERILLVEDNDAVRSIARELLTSLEYDVIEAGSGPRALELLRAEERFDLLFTDMVMPGGLTGIELAEEMRRSKPELKVLYTSGYTGSMAKGGLSQASGNVLQKPYLKESLAKSVRETLDH